MTNLDWTLLIRYAAGECSPQERADVQRELANSSHYSEALAAIDWVAVHADVSVTPERRVELQAALRSGVANSRRGSRIAFALKIAAAIAIVAGASLGGYAVLRHPAGAVVNGAADGTAHTYTTARGQRLSLRLSDGTLVVLAPASALRLPSDYGVRDRALELIGEAAFTVTHDDHRPFVVRAGDLIAKDLGTEFVVRAYPEQVHAEVIVREGIVGIRAAAISDTAVALVRPGQRGWLSPVGRPMTQPIDTAAAFAWTQGRLVLRDMPLSEATAQLERLYDIEIRIAAKDFADQAVSGTIVETHPVSEALATIAVVLGLDVVATGPRAYLLRAR